MAPKSIGTSICTNERHGPKMLPNGNIASVLEAYLSLDFDSRKNISLKEYLSLLNKLRRQTPRFQFTNHIARVVQDLLDAKLQLPHTDRIDLMLLTSNISCYHLTVDIFRTFSSSDLPTDKLAYNVALNAAVKLQDFSLLKGILADFRQAGVVPDIATFTILIEGYLLHGQIAEAEKAFAEIYANKLQPNLSTYNVYIKGLANLNQIDEAMEMYRQMKRHEVTPDIQLFSTIIDGLFKNRRRALVQEVWLDMLAAQLKPNLVTYNIVIDGFMKSKNVSAAERALEQMTLDGKTPDIVTYTILIHGYIKNARLEKAVSTWKQAVDSNIALDTVLFNCLINAFFNCKDQKHKLVISELLSTIPDIQHRTDTFNVITKNTTTVSSIQDALDLLDSMSREGLVPSLATHLFLMTSLMKRQDLPGVMKLYSKLEESPTKMDLAIHGVVMKAFVNHKDVEAARNILEGLIESGVRPNHILFSIVAQGYAQAKDVFGVKWVYHQMLNLKVSPDTYLYNVVAKSYLNSKHLPDAKQLFKNMVSDPQFRPNDDTFYILMEGFLRHQETLMAARVLNYMKSIRHLPKRASLKQQIGRVKEVMSQRQKLPSKSVKPRRPSSI
ncbi:TPR-like protein [Basidiobolus meristosporus CBS 931.73]|uniref:TPR-like protein n=1 Tax=Basidiobolus meristosporus CBS 931.73 TaxID=1314790 RepID=A0A1Y1WXL3_9FUNG|nr:TPR-like protein [Basidiobolus meristosporus CBS 931.73]|eukprot:ORX77946.1 TPR-like protein [Basidiobolus meristosporus CBS 931.73]